MNTLLRTSGLTALSIAIVLVLVLHLVSDVDPIRQRISEYATGSAGFVMMWAFLLSGIGLMLVGILFVRSQAAVAGFLIVVAGFGMLLSGLFPTDPGANTTAEEVHSAASALATLLIVAASIVWSSFNARSTLTTKVFAATGLILLVASVFLHDTTVSGLSQRLLWAALMTWVLSATWLCRSEFVTADT